MDVTSLLWTKNWSQIQNLIRLVSDLFPLKSLGEKLNLETVAVSEKEPEVPQ